MTRDRRHSDDEIEHPHHPEAKEQREEEPSKTPRRERRDLRMPERAIPYDDREKR